MAIDPKIIEKIQKLLNLKEGAESVGSYAEAENAAQKLQAMLFKYNLDLETVKASQIEKKAQIFDGSIDLSDKQGKKESFWVPKLYGAIARNMLCYVSVYERGIRIIGEKLNVELVLYISEQMISKIRIAEKFGWKEYEASDDLEQWQKEKRGTFRRGFYQGAAAGIDIKLAREKQAMEDEKNKMGLMIISKKKIVDDYLEEKYWKPMQKRREEQEASGKKTKKIRLRKGPREIGSEHGFASGHQAGLNMNIDQGLKNKPNKGNLE